MNKQKPKRQKTTRYIMGALPTPERHRHQGGLRCGFAKVGGSPKALTPRYRARWASPLDLYRDRKLIDRAQHQAGLRFGRAYRYAISGSPACRDRTQLFGTSDETNTPDTPLMKALNYIKEAYAALSSDVLCVVIDVCAYDRPTANPQALGKLCNGLGRMALEWGMASSELCHRNES